MSFKTITSACILSATLTTVAGIAVAQDATVRFWTLQGATNQEFYELAEKNFEEANPGVDVVVEYFPNEAYKTAIQVALNGSEPPDAFFNWVGADTSRLINDGLAMDISAFGKDEGGFQAELSEGWLSSMRLDDGLYGVPMEANSKYFYYNIGFFEEHDLNVPENFDGLLQLCRDVRAIDADIVPMPLGNSERWKLIHFMTMLNERVVGAEAAAADYALAASADDLFTNPGYVAAWEKLLELQGAGCFQDAPNATSPELTRSMFTAEASPMIYCGTWCAGIFDSEGFTDYAMFRMPMIDGGAGAEGTNMVFIQGFQVATATENPEETVAWLSYLVTPEMGAKYAEINNRIPSNPTMLESSQGLTDQFKWIAADISSVTQPINVLDVLLENSVAEAYLDAGVEVLNGTLTPEGAVEAIRNVALAAM
ncbi:ABC transporter substrate-binding protein [uncultured Tateyamaria sp.]|uniref:ABC transporter substrate-binding protein n=1 Tax=uncultured Tateyamaria sp. TaxID=455651 RepID=UPI00263365BB|nr:extracellular solute-binding protein [uncultured Tateyamaria sp.]